MTARRPGAPRRAGRPVSSSSGHASGGSRKPSARTSRRERTAAASRPAGAARQRRTAAAVPPEERAPVWGITRRALVLIALVVVALATLVPTVNRYVTQRQQLAAAEQQVAQQRQDVKDLEAEVARWDDPTFVASQARERLLFAMPGETQYRLTDSSGKDVPATEAQQEQAPAVEEDWYDSLWTSVEGSSRLRPEDIPDSQTPGGDGSASPSPSPDALGETAPTDQDPAA